VLFDDDDQASLTPEPAPRAKIVPFGTRRAPDWLTGPGEDMSAAEDPQAPEAPPPSMPAPVLSRPGAPEVEMAPGIEPASASAFAVPPGPASGEAVPSLEAGPEWTVDPPPAGPRPPRPRRVPDPSGPWAPVASSVPLPKLSLVEKPEPQPAGVAETAPSVPLPHPGMLPGQDDDVRRPVLVAPAPAPLVEPWWVVALDNLRANRRAQLAVAGALVAVVVLASWMWPRGVGTTPLSQIRRHPSDFDGREVVVRGRVGDDVFAMGAGWAFYLMQGRDTIVAFSLSRTPEPRKVVTLKGQVSTGFLDGMPRQALFEGGAPLQQ
jgi:hypothetical protein